MASWGRLSGDLGHASRRRRQPKGPGPTKRHRGRESHGKSAGKLHKKNNGIRKNVFWKCHDIMVISRGNFRSFPMAFLGVSAFSPGTAVGGAGDLLHGLCLCGTDAKPPRGLLGRYGARRRGAQFTGRDAVRENRGLGMFDGIYDNIYIYIYIYYI